MTIGEHIREERKKQGLTLNELGEKLGISGSLVGQYERGTVNPKIETVAKFAKALGVNPGDLIGEIRYYNGDDGKIRGGIAIQREIMELQMDMNKAIVSHDADAMEEISQRRLAMLQE